MKKSLSLGGVLAVALLLGAGCNMNATNVPNTGIDTNTNTMLEKTNEQVNKTGDNTVTLTDTNKEDKPEVGYGSAGGSNSTEIEYYSIASQNIPSVSEEGWLGYSNDTYGYKFSYPSEFGCQKEEGSLDCELETCKQPPTEMDRPEMVVRNRVTCYKTCEIQEGTFSCSPSQVRIVTYEKKVPVDMQKFCTSFYNTYNNTCLFEKLVNVETNEARYTYITRDNQNGENIINDFYYIVPENSEFMYQIISSNNTEKMTERAEIEQMIKNITYKK